MIAALAAQKYGKPVRITLTTGEDMTFAGAKHELITNYHATYDQSGKIKSARFNSFANAGSSHDLSNMWTEVLFLYYVLIFFL